MNNEISIETDTIVSSYLAALGKRNLDDILDLFANEVDWLVPGEKSVAPWVGKRSTRKEIEEFFQLLWANTKALDATIEHVMIRDNHAVITGAFSTLMLKTGGIFESLFSIQITVEDNKITRYRLLEDSNGLVKALSAS